MVPGKCFVGIGAYNAEARLVRCLDELRATHGDIQVVVLADGDPAATEAVCSKHGIETINPSGRVGIVRARRMLMDRAVETDCEWFIFIDSDVYATDHDWLAKCIANYRDGITGPKLVLPDGRIWGAGGCWRRNAGMPYGLDASVRGFHTADSGEWDTPCQVPHVVTAAAFMRMELLHCGLRVDVSGGNLRACEDTDLCMSVTFDFDESCWYVPDPVFVHDAFSDRAQRGNMTREYLATVHQEQQVGVKFFWSKWGPRIVERWPSVE